MTIYSRGEVLVVDFPATSGQPGKTRPSLVVFDSGDADIIIAKLTTRGRRGPYDVVLVDWAQAGLSAPSTVRIDKLLTTEKSLIKRSMGSLSANDRLAVAAVFKSMFSNW
jgi:mRNA-degrading endonuclease toxin of MazEF toxin-antitoxin module